MPKTVFSLAPLLTKATKTFTTPFFIKTPPTCSSSVTNTFCFFRFRGRHRSAHTIQRTRDERFFSMGAMVSRDGTNSSSNTKTNYYSFNNEKKRQRGGGKKKTLTTIVSAAQAAKSNDPVDNDDNDELLKLYLIHI